MKYRHIPVVLTTAVLLLSASLSFATENVADETGDASSKPKVSKKSTAARRSEIAAQRAEVAKIKPVDINSATSEELKKLPGIGDAEAAKIIAGRPYGSKAWLVTKNIIDGGLFEGIKKLIIARQPFKDAAKNAAIYEKKK